MSKMRLEHYPPEFNEICERILQGEEMQITFSTRHGAKALQNKFYQWRANRRTEPPLPPGLEEVCITPCDNAGGTCTLRFWPRSTSNMAEAARAMLQHGTAVQVGEGFAAGISQADALCKPHAEPRTLAKTEPHTSGKPSLANWLSKPEPPQ